jgi:thiamine pyrophosphokinase
MVLVQVMKKDSKLIAPTTIGLLVGGEICGKEFIEKKIQAHTKIVAVDGGLHHCHIFSITPDLIIGDFDSIDSELLEIYKEIPKLSFPVEKDETDLELALQIVCKEENQEVYVYGALGGRLDHLLGNVTLLSRYPGKVFIETERELTFVINGSVELSSLKRQTVSLIPLNGRVEGISSRGLKWELHDDSMDKNFLGISNRCLSDSFFVSVKKGDLLCCLLK